MSVALPLTVATGATAALFVAIGCSHTDAPHDVRRVDGAVGEIVVKASDALGGREALLGLEALEIRATGERLEPGQGRKPAAEAEDMHVSDYAYRLLDDLRSDHFAIEWARDVIYPYPVHLRYTNLVGDGAGLIEGHDGIFSQAEAPMLRANVTAMRKLRWLTSPHLLLREALRHPDRAAVQADEEFLGRRHHVVALSVKDSAQPIRLFVDARTALVSKVDTLEEDPVYGDVVVEVLFEDWRHVAESRFAHVLTHKVHGRAVQTERRTSIRTDLMVAPGLPDRLLAARPSGRPDDEVLAARTSQWFLRMHAYGIPHYDRHRPVILTDVAPGIVHVTGGTHHSLVVEMDDHLVVIEGPLYEERTTAVLASLRQRWPEKPVRMVVNTHFHDDHIGGLRAYAAAGATIVTSGTNLRAVDALLSTPRTVFPDALQRSPRTPRIEPVAGTRVLTGGPVTIELMHVQSSHSNDMLLAYLPEAAFLFVSDIYSPGAGPEPFKVFNRELLSFLLSSGLVVSTVGATHGEIGSFEALKQFLREGP